MQLNKNFKVFMTNISRLAAKITVYLAKKDLIFLLLLENIIIILEYSDFADVFLNKIVKIFLKSIGVK